MEGSFPGFSVEMGDFEVKKTATFDRIWKITTGGSMAQLPLLYDGRLYVGSFNHNMYCLDAQTGKLAWKFRTRDRIGVAAPVASKGIIYIGSYDQNFYALDARTGELIWKYKTEDKITTRAVVIDDAVCFGSVDRNFYALRKDNGQLLWKFRTMGHVTSDPTPFNGNVLFGSHDENFYCVNVKSGKLLWKFRTQDEIVNSGRFAIDGEHVYLTSMDNMLYKIRLQDGFLIWKKKMASYGLCCSPTMGESDVFVPSDDGNVFRIDTGGNIKWKFSTTKPVGVVTVHHGKVYFTCEDKNMYCINAETGKLVWNFRTQELNWWGVAAEDKRIYFCSYDCHVYALDSEAGGLIWKFRTDGSPSYIPPHNDMYEFVIKVPESEINENKEKRYDIKISSEEDGDVNFYKSRLTYQVSTQYAAKGKYQIDSDEEEF